MVTGLATDNLTRDYMITISSNGILPTRILIFSHFSDRESTALLHSIAKFLHDVNIRICHSVAGFTGLGLHWSGASPHAAFLRFIQDSLS